MNEVILSGNNVTTTVRSDVRVAEKLDTTVEAFTTDKRNTASSRIIESALNSIFIKESKKFESSSRMNLANFVPVESPDLVSFRDPTIQIDNVLDRSSDSVATRISNKDGIWEPTVSNIGTEATHGKIKMISEKLAYRKYIKDSEFETSKSLSGKISRGGILKILRLD